MTELASLLFDNFGKVIAIIILLTLAVIAIFKINIKLDMNEHLKDRKRRHARQAQHYCPHMEFKETGDGMGVVSWYESPSGTTSWICRVCQSRINHFDQEEQERAAEYWAKNTKRFKKNMKKFNYHSKRAR